MPASPTAASHIGERSRSNTGASHHVCGRKERGEGRVPREHAADGSCEERCPGIAERIVKMWFDPEADFLEVTFDQKPGYFLPTENNQVMERVDEEGNVIGFTTLGVSSLRKAALEVALR